MKKHLLFVAFVLASSFAIQAQTLDWAAQFGGNSYEAGKSIATDASGNVYSTGYFYGTSDFDPGAGHLDFTSVAAGADIYISKLDASGNLAWAKHIGGDGSDHGRGIAVNQTSGDVYVTGWYSDTVDFDPGAGVAELMSPGIEAMYLLKLNAAGDFGWVKTLSGGGTSYGFALTLDLTGNVVVAGDFNGTVDFDPGAGTQTATASALIDAFVLALDANGNYLMDVEFGGTGSDEIFGIALDLSGNIYVTGGFDGTTDLDPGAGTTNYTADGSDIFVSKLDVSGNLIWGKHMGGTNDESGNSIGVDGLGNVYTTGKFKGTVDFDPDTNGTSYTANGFSDAFLTRLGASGNLIWAVKIGGPGLDEGVALTMAADGGIVWTGGFQDTIDIEIGSGVTNLYNAEGTDIFVAKFNNNASLAWAKNMGGNGSDWGYAIALDPNDNVVLTGQITMDSDLDPNAGTVNFSSFGENDIFVAKLALPTGKGESGMEVDGISLNPNPTRSMLQIKVSQATDVAIMNLIGAEMAHLKIETFQTVDVCAYPSGIYFVRDLNTGETVKFIKQ